MSKKTLILAFAVMLSFLPTAFAQDIVELPAEPAVGVSWSHPQKEYFSTEWKTSAITNVSTPSMEVYLAPEVIRTGTSVIIAPGGGLYALSIESEGRDVAKWFNAQGINAFVLRYRLVPSGEDGIKDLIKIATEDNDKRVRMTRDVIPYSVADGLSAVTYIRSKAEEWGIAKDKIGFMGFSGGGCVLLGMVNDAKVENSPDFYIPVYPGVDLNEPDPEVSTPPTLFIAAADDQLMPSRFFTRLYDRWVDAGVSTSIILYANGGHGFGTRIQGKHSDNWLEDAYSWMKAEGFVKEDSP